MAAVLSRPQGFRHVVFAGAVSGRPWRTVARQTPAAPAPQMSLSLSPLLTDEQKGFLVALFEQAGIDPRAYRCDTLARRIPACLRMLRVSSIAQATGLLRARPALCRTALSALVMGVTSFFRDAAVFEALESRLPALLADKRGAGLRIWSAGCSDGAELYSVAILLAQLQQARESPSAAEAARGPCAADQPMTDPRTGRSNAPTPPVAGHNTPAAHAKTSILGGNLLLGTDCRADAVARARAGLFEFPEIQNLRPPWHEQHFHHRPPRWQISARIMAATRWRMADVTRACEPGPWDLILCRNMVMYFQPDVATRIWRAMERSLRPGGLIVLGRAERPVGTDRLTAVGPCIYQIDRGQIRN